MCTTRAVRGFYYCADQVLARGGNLKVCGTVILMERA